MLFPCPIQVNNSLLPTGVFTGYRIKTVVFRMILICDVVFGLVYRFLTNTSLDPLENHRATKPDHSMLDHHLPYGKTPFKWRFAGWPGNDGPLLVVFRSSLLPSSTKKNPSELGPLWQNMDPCMLFISATLKKLRGHIAFGFSVHPSFTPSQFLIPPKNLNCNHGIVMKLCEYHIKTADLHKISA